MKAFYENRTYHSEIPLSVSFSENLDFVAHWHRDIEVVYVCEGSIGVGVNSAYRVLRKGEASICWSNDIHYYDSEGMRSRLLLLIFRPELLNGFRHWPHSLHPGSVFLDEEYGAANTAAAASTNSHPNQAMKEIRALFDGIVMEKEKQERFHSLFTELKIYELFLMLFRHFPAYHALSERGGSTARIQNEITPMQKALQFLEEHSAQNISLDEISQEVNLSRFHFSRLFKKTTGMNFNVYLNRIRADKAEELILTTTRTMVEIAYETGFPSVRTFNRAFRTIKGCTPQSVRSPRSESHL